MSWLAIFRLEANGRNVVEYGYEKDIAHGRAGGARWRRM